MTEGLRKFPKKNVWGCFHMHDKYFYMGVSTRHILDYGAVGNVSKFSFWC